MIYRLIIRFHENIYIFKGYNFINESWKIDLRGNKGLNYLDYVNLKSIIY